ncbi:MAG: amidase [Pseudomonadota bacterium]|nr:amidase [Pseudomonadales bacterium]MDY6918746.1 amidase [Pseudomonadota bacterium]
MTTEWGYQTARQLLQSMKSGKLSSRQLVDSFIQRIETYNPQLNAVVATDFSAARKRADEADAARAAGESWGPLHGLPMTVKDTYEVVGMPCVAGAASLRDHLPRQQAVAVARLQEAGAIICGKTNVPVFASDLQSFNKVYGTTNNPWNTRYTPGGSSGGAAAALAAGLTPLELGSDIGGSIRTPAHFCGVYGHKTSHGIISLRGHIPGPPGTVSESDMAVAGPMARSADDLQLLLNVVAGPSPLMAPGWQLKLPAARHRKLQDFKVLMWLEDPLCPVAGELLALYAKVQAALEQAGVSVTRGAPLGMELKDFYPTYLNLLGSVLGASQKKYQRRAMALAAPLFEKVGKRLDLPRLFEHFLEGVGQSHVDWMRHNEKRYRLREKFKAVFDQYDVILMPVTMSTAFQHLQEQEIIMRKLPVDGRKRSYPDLFMWIAPATLMGLPATSAPVGVTADGLPANIQILGAPFEDKTTIKFAALLEQLGFGFQRPPGY